MVRFTQFETERPETSRRALCEDVVGGRGAGVMVLMALRAQGFARRVSGLAPPRARTVPKNASGENSAKYAADGVDSRAQLLHVHCRLRPGEGAAE